MRRVLQLVIATSVLIPISVHAQYNGTCATPSDVSSLPAGHWCEVPNSHLRSTQMRAEDWPDWNGTTSPSYESYQRVSGVKGVIKAWSGAAWDSRRDRLVIFGGGHNDYGGNEVYAFSLDSLSWDRLTDPTGSPNRRPETENRDGTPISRHTYGGLTYVSHLDLLFALGGAPDSAAGGCGTPGTWTLDLGTLAWDLRSGDGEPRTGCENNAVYDPESRRVYFAAGGSWRSFDPDANTWAQVGAEGARGGTRAIVPGDRRFIVEFGNDAVVDGFRRWDLTGGGLAPEVVSTSGPADMTRVMNPGAAYDSMADRIVAWSGGTAVYSLDVDRAAWEQHPAPATNQADPGDVAAAGGTYGRFQYSVTYNVLVTVDSVDENVFLYRLGEGGGTPRFDAGTPELDAGVDAAVLVPDAGTPDGGSVDGGVRRRDAAEMGDARAAGAGVVTGGCGSVSARSSIPMIALFLVALLGRRRHCNRM